MCVCVYVFCTQSLRVSVRAEGPTRVFEISDTDRTDVISTMKPESRLSRAVTMATAAANVQPFGFTLHLAGVGVGLIDHRPRELLYAVLQDIVVEYQRNPVTTTCEVQLRRLEVDNQSIDTPYPIVLEPQRALTAAGAPVEDAPESDRNVLEYTLEMQTAGCVGFHYVKSCTVKVWRPATCKACPLVG